MQKRADTNQSFSRGFGKADVFIPGNPEANGGRGVRSIVTTPSGGTIRRQVGGRQPRATGSFTVPASTLNQTNTTNRNTGRTDQT